MHLRRLEALRLLQDLDAGPLARGDVPREREVKVRLLVPHLGEGAVHLDEAELGRADPQSLA
eukprot:4149973-Prymnesium_polylepis.1